MKTFQLINKKVIVTQVEDKAKEGFRLSQKKTSIRGDLEREVGYSAVKKTFRNTLEHIEKQTMHPQTSNPSAKEHRRGKFARKPRR